MTPSPETQPAEERRRSWLSLVVAILLSLTWFALAVLQSLVQKWNALGQHEWWPAASLWRLILGLPLYLILVPLVWMALRRRTDPVSWSTATGWRLPGTRMEWVWLVAFLAAAGLSLLYPGAAGRVAAQLSTPVLALVALQPPLVEETLMRGLFVHVMDRGRWERWVTTLLGALCFALWHVVSFGPSGWLTGVLSIPFFFVPRFLTGGMLVTVVLHLFLNSGPTAFLWGLVLLVEMAALIYYLVRWWRRRKHPGSRPQNDGAFAA